MVHDMHLCGWEGSTGALSNKFIDCCLVEYAVEGISVLCSPVLAKTSETLTQRTALRDVFNLV